ncbi:DUF2252 domain-containing protein [Effusibacillus lacus]|uniref:DUF2252 domain-containing protein n=1 Tax=Effusibacillus lacus TaxID=1348429 RepID=A0A292YJZ3_9BACL|nr:DUF2252 family protein [Effusibacillus lacus]TCS75120.1 uncharacterized protein (DUF2252 family) [Effusibacillus lacus]GAX89073.1 hypothetical protein EFBL_0687 [Effusibacillus lacus]
MGTRLGERVKQTQKNLRMQALVTVFDEFDGQIMQLDEEKRGEKYRKMSGNPFSFFRGSAYLFYFDATREWLPYHTRPDRPTWIQGDLHFENFGAFHNGKGALVFDVNDFDEGYLGSYLYDLMRMSVSIALVCRLKGFPVSDQTDAITAYLKAYHKQIRRFARGKEDPASFVLTEENTEGQIRKLLKKLEKKKKHHFLEKVTALLEGTRQFSPSDEIQPASPEERELLLSAWPAYIDSLEDPDRETATYYRIKDIAVKHGSGTASIGLDRFYALIEGGTEAHGMDDIVLEVKEVRVPIPAYFMPYNELFWDHYSHQGKRVIMTQRAMHHEADPFLGYLTLEEREFYVRERSPYKKRLKLESIERMEDLVTVLGYMGQITAKLHARADADIENGVLSYHSEQEILSAMGEDLDAFCATISQWALSYANQVEQDFELFTQWMERR